MTDWDCIVVGGGASGLVSATRMAAAGRRSLLLEAEQRLGGCVQSWSPEQGFWLELGAHTAYNSYAPLLEALAARGRLGELLQREALGYRFIDREGGLQSPLSRLDWLEAVASLPFGVMRDKTGRSVSQWFSGLLGHGNYRRLLSPAFAAVLSQPADTFPAEWLFRRKPRMKAAPRKYTFAGGLQGLLEALAEGAPFECRRGTAVQALSRQEPGFVVHLADGQSLHCRQLLLAVPVDVAARLLAGLYPEVAASLAAYPVASSEALAVVVAKDKIRLDRVAGLIGTDDDFFSVVTRDPVAHPAWRGFTFHFRPGRLDSAGKLARAATLLDVQKTDFHFVRECVNRLPAPGVEHPLLVKEIDARLAGQPLALVGNYLNGLSLGDCAQRAVSETERLLQR